MSQDHAIKSRLKAIQWNNRIFSGVLFLYLFLSVMVLAACIVLPLFLIIGLLIDPPWLLYNLGHPHTLFLRFSQMSIKIFLFCFIGSLLFIKNSIENIPFIFDAKPLELRSTDPLYRTLETLCISRGLQVPALYVLKAPMEQMTTAAVVQGFNKKASILFSQAALKLSPELLEALLAQAVQRIHTRDTLFLTFLSFFGYFPFHIEQSSDKIPAMILKPALFITDKIMAPIRNWIVKLRFARLDAGSLELTKEKVVMESLLQKLATRETFEKYFYDAYAPLFIVQYDAAYQKYSLQKA